METLLLLTTVLALVGAYFNSMGKWQGFAIWIATNLIFTTHNYMIGQWQQALLFACYLVLAANGLRVCLKTAPKQEAEQT